MNRTLITCAGIAVVVSTASAQQKTLPLKYAAKPTTPAITAADLMTRLYIFADDSMMGRQAGTVYHDKGTAYIASELKRLGLTPAGENGTYFQHIPLLTRTLAQGAKVTVDGREFVAGKDFLPRDNGPAARSIENAAVIYGGVYGMRDNMASPETVAGKVVVLTVPRGWQANRGQLSVYYANATAVVIASLDSMPDAVRHDLAEPGVIFKTGEETPAPAFFYATRAMAETMLGAPVSSLAAGALGKTISGTLTWTESQAPGARNVVAIVPGSDAKVRGQYVAVGAHSDHIGMDAHTDFRLPVDHDSLWAFYHVARPNGADDGAKPASQGDWLKIRALLDSLRKVRTPRLDSIDNGADDDGSGSMALLELAEAFAGQKEKPRRSILLIWHVGEELGLFGSQYFTDHPTVPRDSIVAELNVDMIGRGEPWDLPKGSPGYLESIGSRRLSTELGDIVEAEGRKFTPPFTLSYEFDANGHPQQYYCRSDHYMYARYGIPVAFMSTGSHPEYHQVTDEPQYISYDKLSRVTQLLFNSATRVANLDHRLVVDKPKPDPKKQCVQ